MEDSNSDLGSEREVGLVPNYGSTIRGEVVD